MNIVKPNWPNGLREQPELRYHLKNCPFCGEAPHVYLYDDDDRSISIKIQCGGCDANMMTYMSYGSRSPIEWEKGVKLQDEWNTRVETTEEKEI